MTPTCHDRSERGFTLIEVIVVMGILSGFLMMLVQLVDGGLRLFTEGELAQGLADRASRAQRVLTRELGALRGSATGRDRDSVDDRLVVQLLPADLPPQPEPQPSRLQVLRAAVHLRPERERQLAEAMLAVRLLMEKPNASEAELAELAQREKLRLPLTGLGNLLLLPFRQGGDDAVLELRAGWFLPGQLIPVGSDRYVDPFAVPVPGSPDLPGLALYHATQPLLGDLLHVDFGFWGQRTTQWGDVNSTTNSATSALRVWDSARGGWLIDTLAGGTFPFDRGPASLDDPRDDVHPHAIRVQVVVAQPPDFAPEGVLAVPLEVDDTSAVLLQGDRFPGPAEDGLFKVRGEWIGYANREGDTLRGLRRGLRSTRVMDHPAGVRVHVGRTVEFVVPLAHGKDDWNG